MVSVWGTDIDGNPRQARANIGIVPQELNIDAYFTPRETLEMQAGLFGVPASERRSDALLELVGLSEQAHTYARRPVRRYAATPAGGKSDGAFTARSGTGRANGRCRCRAAPAAVG